MVPACYDSRPLSLDGWTVLIAAEESCQRAAETATISSFWACPSPWSLRRMACDCAHSERIGMVGSRVQQLRDTSVSVYRCLPVSCTLPILSCSPSTFVQARKPATIRRADRESVAPGALSTREWMHGSANGRHAPDHRPHTLRDAMECCIVLLPTD